MKFLAAFLLITFTSSVALAHSGGECDKSSPPGKCCHIDKETGKKHCHEK